jgi:hypothetical protein
MKTVLIFPKILIYLLLFLKLLVFYLFLFLVSLLLMVMFFTYLNLQYVILEIDQESITSHVPCFGSYLAIANSMT